MDCIQQRRIVFRPGHMTGRRTKVNRLQHHVGPPTLAVAVGGGGDSRKDSFGGCSQGFLEGHPALDVRRHVSGCHLNSDHDY